jgi:hypothetical protein
MNVSNCLEGEVVAGWVLRFMGDGPKREGNDIAGAHRARGEIRQKPRSRDGSGYNPWARIAISDLEEEKP